MELLKSAVSSVLPLVANRIIEHLEYPFMARGNIRALESATRELQAMKEDVKTEITNAQWDNSAPSNQAREWLSQVEAIENEATEIQHKYQQLCRCVWNISPNFYAIYKISRSAAKKQVEVKNLCDKKATIEVIIQMPPPLAHEMPASSSISPNFREALHYVKDDVHGIIGIWGMGGVGKTHLLKQINNELSNGLAFNCVVFVTCSKECYEEKVQNEIIDNLRLDKNGTMKQKQSTIYNFLRERSFVILLDDLWNRVDLETIGIPDPLRTVGTCRRKVVLTTRSTEVCGQMEVKKRIRVDVLNEDDAWSLFKEKVTAETINSDPLIQKFALDVVKELDGLPLALFTIGRAMHDKMDPSEWEQAIVSLKNARLNDVEFSCVNRSVFHILKFSYDSLKSDTLRQCFLHCSLWPEDFNIGKDALVMLWLGLGLINEPNIQSAYNVGYSYIRRLQAVCLLEIHDDDSRMHDLIRDMAIWIANNQGEDTNKWIVHAGTYTESKDIQISSDTKALSVMNNGAKRILFSTIYSSTKLSTLVLSHNSLIDSKTLQLELFSKLTVLDLSINRLEDFPVEICKLVHLQFLNLSGNPLKSLPVELGSLIDLKYLILWYTNCTFPNKVLSKLKALRVLDLSIGHKAYNLDIFPTIEKDLQLLPHFQALGIIISSKLTFSRFSQTVSVPVRWFDVCKYNESYLSFSSCFFENSHLGSNIVSIHISHSDDIECVKFENESENQSICHLGRLECLFFRWMRNMKKVIWKGLDPKDVFPRLQILEFNFCPSLTSISWVVNLPRIQMLAVRHCTSIKQLIRMDELKDSGIHMSQLCFPFLTKMDLRYSDELELISDLMISFPALEYLLVDNCDKLKNLPFKPSNHPEKLKLIKGSQEWWNNLELEDNDSYKFSLQPFFEKLSSSHFRYYEKSSS